MNLAKILVNREFITKQFIDGYRSELFKVIKGLPENAVLVGSHYDYVNDRLVFTFEHESFPDLSVPQFLAGEIPEYWITCEDLDNELQQVFKIQKITVPTEGRENEGYM